LNSAFSVIFDIFGYFSTFSVIFRHFRLFFDIFGYFLTFSVIFRHSQSFFDIFSYFSTFWTSTSNRSTPGLGLLQQLVCIAVAFVFSPKNFFWVDATSVLRNFDFLSLL
jgi:hypothetical protein